MNPESIQNLAYFAIVVAILSSIPQMIKIIKNKSFVLIGTSTFALNAVVFGIFTLYAFTFQDYFLSVLYGTLFLLNSYILSQKIIN